MKDFPHSKLMKMAILDTVQFSGLTVAAAGISPAMTIILLHSSTPFLVLGSRCMFPDRKYSAIQQRGVQLISLAVLISLVTSILGSLLTGDQKSLTASSLVYVSMAALHGTKRGQAWKRNHHHESVNILKTADILFLAWSCLNVDYRHDGHPFSLNSSHLNSTQPIY